MTLLLLAVLLPLVGGAVVAARNPKQKWREFQNN